MRRREGGKKERREGGEKGEKKGGREGEKREEGGGMRKAEQKEAKRFRGENLLPREVMHQREIPG
ncbi:hypothetical protein ACQJ0S_26825, partial [Klebsiella pneumoniae]|uniref:hypothetical protein n=1 Tax=Klebsiella pneumoniae TaxID=573 RepID=UPI003D00513A